MEARIPTRVGLELSGPDEPLIYETTFTENVSRHGARVVAKRHWRPNDSVLVKLPQECPPARARITYCQPLEGDEFAMGLQFSLPVYSWIGSPEPSEPKLSHRESQSQPKAVRQNQDPLPAQPPRSSPDGPSVKARRT